MLEAINTWNDYRTKIREFDAVLEHGRAVAAALTAATPGTPQASYGEQIFAKLLGHCVALRRLAPDSTPRPLADLPSMSALALCVIEAHDAFEYVAGHAVTASERSFRIRLWELNDATRRLKILARLRSVDPAVAGIRADAARLQLALEAHEYLASLPAATQAELRLRLRRTEPPEFHLSRSERCTLSGVDPDWHKTVTLQLAQQVHTLPFSVHQLPQFEVGSAEAVRLVSQPLVFTLPFLARVIQAVSALATVALPQPPSRTARTMLVWRGVAELSAADLAALP